MVILSDYLWIREICRLPNETIAPKKNATQSNKTKVSLGMAERGALKGSGSQIV
jgi:hypothetical protein